MTRFSNFTDLLQSGEKSALAARDLWGIYSSDDYYLNRQWNQTNMVDFAKATQWRKKAAALGHPEALLEIARDEFKKGAFEKAGRLLHEALESEVFLKLTYEMRREIKQACTEMLEDARVNVENKKLNKKAEKSIDKLKGPEAYNRAVQLLAEPDAEVKKEQIEQLLRYAAEKGVFQATKLLNSIQKSKSLL